MRSDGRNVRAILSLLAVACLMSSLAPPTARANAASPKLVVAGVKYYENDGVEPIEGKVGDTFSFAIRYQDLDNDPPKKGYPRLLLDTDNDGLFNGGNDLNLTTENMKAMDTNYNLGVDYAREWVFDGPGTYSYAFCVMNERNETSFIGPFDGPVVRAKDQGHAYSDRMTEYGLFGLLLAVVSIVFMVVGIGVGQGRERERRRRLLEGLKKR